MAKHLALFLLILGSGLCAVCVTGRAAPAGTGLERFTFSEPHMGTTVRIVLYAPDAGAAKKAAEAAFARIAALNRIMSDYDPDSELMRLCKTFDVAVPVSPELFTVMQEAQKYARLSDGAFDVSIGPVVRLWRKARRTREMPSAEALKTALARVDYRKIQLDPKARTVRLLLMGMLLDLGGIAKGYAADAALAVLRAHGIRQALIALGGDIAVGDPPPNAPGWRVGVAPLRNPDAPPLYYLILKNAGVSTAGDLHQAVEIAGQRFSHIVDPKTGLGLTGRRSATVIAPNTTTSDGLDTAICVIGSERGMDMVEALEGVAALYVYETGEGEVREVRSKGFARFLDSVEK